MRISAKAEYAIQAVLDLALHRERGLTAIQEIARRQAIPQRYLEQVLLALQRSRGLPLTGVATDVELRLLGAGTVRLGIPNRLADLFTPY